VKKGFLVALACMLFSVVGCSMIHGSGDTCSDCKEDSCGNSKDKGHIRGREIIEKGKPVTLSGVLKEDGEEWCVVSAGKTYNTHFGKEDYRTEKGINLKEGKKVRIEGVGVGNDIAVCVLTMDGKRTRFRKKDGTPMWSGKGGSHGKGEGKGKGKGKNKDCDK